ncbi:MAG TPA: 16S rRNA (adenine(1518)-N(6)/adenine(1519)-N(6))-dimethyltransferase RsmA [Planctomycetota bacterium]|jgi:16S rRNA (adenine1518-N6/adenine1519-N6)-dimethyltransferase|nr:ribosomal RNA small subunit methyltransferase A [Planctomycetota bacterium]OQC22310.1 MAG: Ribosomal RNA small subunit methyltransferase A [Planctomycetes bacterium ADurb.Bin069]HNS00614.1 16S rRNA (adenine(1518)-N(6)/adenine(1519)-N(6))-dimethyltransferase RsmA [Planctomycetota bacterium]HNU26733.1 16S rRNA (adenine(1518)-N(6)/adenine(1519)-N(6))-dimethyltransferase RsmA [Planctomycetota bacterium]HOE29239.1 16S rRNA (adenine(1518)-N(6)/adenine(1519)-N(6))-dimethyltransferase RsmA [Planctom
MGSARRRARPEGTGEGARLRRRGLAPRRRLGQHFLFNPRLLEYLIAQAGLREGARVLEVGPGSGALTRRLLAAGAAVTAVELDRGLCGVLREEFGDREGLTLIEGDILAGKHALNPAVLSGIGAPGTAFSLVANLPFNVATPLLLLLLELCPDMEKAVVTVQDEVADRFIAASGAQAYGGVSVLAQTLAAAEKLLRIEGRSFSPPPKVDAAVLRVTPRVERPPQAVYTVLKELVAWAFSQRRKQLLPRVASKWPGAACACPARARPEEIAPAVYLALAEAINAVEPRGGLRAS